MKAFIVDHYGKKDGVRIGEMQDPELREDDVLVQVHAAGVNLLDSKTAPPRRRRRCVRAPPTCCRFHTRRC